MRYFARRKSTVEESKSLSVFQMKAWGFYQEKSRWGEFAWTADKDNTVVKFQWDKDRLALHVEYAFADDLNDPRAVQDYFIRFTTTPCHFGGRRYWMHCPECQKRVGKLYLAGKYIFACRTCWRLTYSLCNASGIFRYAGKILSFPQLDDLRSGMRSTRYKGKPTKKLLRYQKYRQKLEHTEEHWFGDTADLLKR